MNPAVTECANGIRSSFGFGTGKAKKKPQNREVKGLEGELMCAAMRSMRLPVRVSCSLPAVMQEHTNRSSNGQCQEDCAHGFQCQREDTDFYGHCAQLSEGDCNERRGDKWDEHGFPFGFD